MASTIQLRIPRGNTVTKQFTAFNGTGYLDPTGYNVVMTIKDSETSSDGAADTIIVNGTWTDPSTAQLQVVIPGSDLPQAEVLWYRVDAVQIADPTVWFTIAKGSLYIEPV